MNWVLDNVLTSSIAKQVSENHQQMREGWVGRSFFVLCLVFWFLSFLEESWKNREKLKSFGWVGLLFVCFSLVSLLEEELSRKKEKKENSNLSKSEGHITP